MSDDTQPNPYAQFVAKPDDTAQPPANPYAQFAQPSAGSNPYAQYSYSGADGQPVPKRGAIGEIANQLKAGFVSDLPKMAGQALQYSVEPGDKLYEVGKSIADYGRAQALRPDLQPQEDSHNIVTNTLASGARMIPQSIVPAMVTGLAIAKPTKGLPMMARMGIGAVGSSLPAAMSQGQDTLDKAREKGIPEDQAREAARITAFEEGTGESIGTFALGKLFGLAGRAVAKSGVGTAAEQALEGATSTQVLKPWLRELPHTMAVEVGTEMGQNASEAETERRYGIDDHSPWDAAKEAIGPTIGMTLLLAPFGLAGHAMDAGRTQHRNDIFMSPDADQQQRQQVVDEIAPEIGKVDAEAERNFRANAARAIAAKQALPIDGSLFADPSTVQAPPVVNPDDPAAGAEIPPENPLTAAASRSPVRAFPFRTQELAQKQADSMAARDGKPYQVIPHPTQQGKFIAVPVEQPAAEAAAAAPLAEAAGVDAAAQQAPAAPVGLQPGEAVQVTINGEDQFEHGTRITGLSDDGAYASVEGSDAMVPVTAITRIDPAMKAAIDQAASEAATSPSNDRKPPSEAQQRAGNYKMGPAELQGVKLMIENEAGTTREGKDEDGTPWSTKMQDHYGYISGTKGADGDAVDTYIGPNPASHHVFVIDQLNQDTGEFDEHKVMLGYNSPEQARRAYEAHYTQGWQGGENITATTVDGLKKWIKEGDTTAPFNPAYFGQAQVPAKAAPAQPQQAAPQAASGDLHQQLKEAMDARDLTKAQDLRRQIQREQNERLAKAFESVKDPAGHLQALVNEVEQTGDAALSDVYAPGFKRDGVDMVDVPAAKKHDDAYRKALKADGWTLVPKTADEIRTKAPGEVWTKDGMRLHMNHPAVGKPASILLQPGVRVAGQAKAAKAATQAPAAPAVEAPPVVQATKHSEIIDVPDFVAKSTPVGHNDAGEALYDNERGRFRLRRDRPDRPHGYPDFGGDLAPIKRSEAYGRHRATIERQLSQGWEIPAGVHEQIGKDKNLQGGEVEHLQALAHGLKGGAPRELTEQQLKYRLQNYHKDGKDKDGNQVWRQFNDAGEGEIAVDAKGRIVRDYSVTKTYDLDDKRSVEVSHNDLTKQWFATEYDRDNKPLKILPLSEAEVKRLDREKMIGEKFGAGKVEELDRKVARTPAKAWATRPDARKVPGFNRQDLENDVRAYDHGIVGTRTDPSTKEAHKALGKKLADPANYMTPAGERAARIAKLDTEIADHTAKLDKLEADQKKAAEKNGAWQFVTSIKVQREFLASAKETRDSLAKAQEKENAAAAEPSTFEKPSLHDQLEALRDNQAHHPKDKLTTRAGNHVFSFKFRRSIPISQEALDQFVPLKGEELKAASERVEKQWEVERQRQQDERDNFPTRGFEHVIKPDSSDSQLQLATAIGWGYTKETVPVRYPGNIDTVFHDFERGLEYDNGKRSSVKDVVKFAVLVAQGPNGNWTYSTEHTVGGSGSGGSHPSIWDPQYPTRAQAITAGTNDLRQQFKQREDVLKLIDREYAKLGITGEAKAIAPTGDWPWKGSPFAARIEAVLAKLAEHVPDYLKAYRSGFVQDATANRLTEESVAFKEKKVDQLVGEKTGKTTAVPFTPIDAAGMQKVSDVSDALPKEIVDAAIAKWNPVAEQLAKLGYQHGEVFTNAPYEAQKLERQLKDIANALMALAPRRWLVERDKKAEAPKTEKETKRRAATLRHLERAEDYATEVLGIDTRAYPAVDTANRITLGAGIRKKAGELEALEDDAEESAAPAMKPKGTWQESPFAKRIETMMEQLRAVGRDDMARVVEDDMKTAAGRGLLDEAEVKRKEELTRNILKSVAPKDGQPMVVTKGEDNRPQIDHARIEFKGSGYSHIELPAPLVARVQNVLRTRPDAYHVSRAYQQNDTRIRLGQEDARGPHGMAELLLLDNGNVTMLGDDAHHWGSTMTQASAIKALNNWLNSLPEKAAEIPGAEAARKAALEEDKAEFAWDMLEQFSQSFTDDADVARLQPLADEYKGLAARHRADKEKALQLVKEAGMEKEFAAAQRARDVEDTAEVARTAGAVRARAEELLGRKLPNDNPRDLPNGMWGTVDNPLKFVSGMSRPGDYTRLFAGHRSVGVMVSELSNKDVDKALAEQMAKSNGYLFVDSGAFPIYKLNERAFAKALEEGFEDFKGEKILTFDQILDRYERLDDAISKASDGEANDRVFFVMPDIVGKQEESLRLVGEFSMYINDYGDRAIVPLQSGKLSLTQAYESAMLELSRDPDLDDGPIIGIPSAAEAVSNEELTALLKKHGDRIAGVHVLGAYSGLRLAPRLKAIREAGYEGNVSADANRLRALMYGDRTRGQAWEELFAQSQPEGGKVDTTEQRANEANNLTLTRWGFTPDTVPKDGRFRDWEVALRQNNGRFGKEQFAFEISVAQAPNGKWAYHAAYTQGGNTNGASSLGMLGGVPRVTSPAYATRMKAIEAGSDAIRAELLKHHGDITRLVAPLHSAVKRLAEAEKAKPAAEPKRVVKGFATMDQEAERATLLARIVDRQSRNLSKETADGRRKIAKEIREAEKELGKLPAGRLTLAGVRELGRDSDALNGARFKDWIEAAKNRVRGKTMADLEAVYANHHYNDRGEPTLTKEFYAHLLAEQAGREERALVEPGWIGTLDDDTRENVRDTMQALRQESNTLLRDYQRLAPIDGIAPQGGAYVDALARGQGLAVLLQRLNVGDTVSEAKIHAKAFAAQILGNAVHALNPVYRSAEPVNAFIDEAGQKILDTAAENGAPAQPAAKAEPTAAAAPAPVPAPRQAEQARGIEYSDDHLFDAEFQDALGHLGDVLGDVFGGKLNMTGQKYTAGDLLPALSKVIEMLVRKGLRSFSKAVATAARGMRANEKTAPFVDQISPRQWKAAYNAIAEMHEGTETEEAVNALSNEEVQRLVAPSAPANPTPAEKVDIKVLDNRIREIDAQLSTLRNLRERAESTGNAWVYDGKIAEIEKERQDFVDARERVMLAQGEATPAPSEPAAPAPKKPAKPGKVFGQARLRQDFGVPAIDGYTETSEFPHGEPGDIPTGGVKAAFIKDAQRYLKDVTGMLLDAGFTNSERNGKAMKPVTVNEGGPAVGGDVYLTMFHEGAERGIYIHVGTGGYGPNLNGTASGVTVMMRVTKASDPYGGAENIWLPSDLTAAELAERARKAVFAASPNRDTLNATATQEQEHGPDDAGGNGTQALGEVATGEDGAAQGRGPAERGGPGSGTASPGGNAGTDGAGVSGARSGRGGTAAADPAAAGTGRGQPGSKGRGRGGEAVPGVHEGAAGNGRVTPAPANVPAVNFRITEALRLGQGGEAVKFTDNVEAIRTLKRVEAENRRATPEEQAILARYVGWGGLKNAFPDPLTGEYKPDWNMRGRELRYLLTDKEHAAASRSTLDAHYTSEKVVQAMWKAAEHLGFKGGMTLESSMGVGNFLGLVPDSLAPNTKFVGVEYDAITARIAALLYPQETVLHSGFQKVPLSDKVFDLAIGNPPFGSQSLSFQFKPEFNGLSIHNQFFLASIDAVKPGGLQIQVVSRYLLDAVDPTARTMLAQRARLLGAIRLPDSAFKENARTDVVTDIVFLQRLTRAEEVEMQAAFEAARAKPSKNAQDERERRQLAAKVPEWVQTGKINDPAGGEQMVVNNYYVANPSMVMGTLERSGSMHGREEVNVKLEKGQNLAAMLDKAISRLPQGAMTAQPDPVEEMRAAHQAMSDSLRIALAGDEAGSIRLDVDGNLQQVVERETPNGDYELARRTLTAKSAWSPSLLQDNRGRWYRVEAVLDDKGKPVKRTVMVQGKEVQTKQNLYERRYFDSEADVPGNLQLGETRFARLKEMVVMRDHLVNQLNLEAEDADPKEIEANRKKLRAAYDAFVAKHGFVNDPANSSLVANMPDGALVQALETSYRPAISAAKAAKIGEEARPAKAKPAPILSARVITKYQPPTQATTAADAVAITMAERGRIDMARIADLLGKPVDEVTTDMLAADKPLVFEDPETGTIVPADEYLSGEVRRKLAAAKDAGLQKNIEALEAVQPEAWGAENVTVLLGSTWVPPEVYAQFVQHITGSEARVNFSKLTNAFSVSTRETVRANEEQWGSDGISAARILEELLNSKTIRLMMYDADGNAHFDEERTKLALLKARAIRNEFNDWVFGDGERRRQLVEKFNDLFNVRVNRQHDGSHLVLPGKVPDSVIGMRRHQKNAIWRGISERFMLLDHAVGAGKTFTAIARAMERRRMGLSRKPMIVVPNHMVEQFTKDAYRLYPGAKVLAAGSKDFEKARRRKLFAKIATGDYDMVIVPHSSFFYIGISPETEERYLQAELDRALAAVKEAEEQAKEDGTDGGRRKPFGVKEAERLVDKITAQMDKVKGAERKDRLLTFEQMGVDDLTVDEAHEFKNLFYSSRLTNVKGMGNKTGSQKAFDLYNKVRVLAESPTGTVTFMTGTPISNSAAEMYTMMRYLAADKLREFGLEHFDAWRAQFVSVDPGWEPNETGRLQEVNRLGRTWSNMRSLMDLYYSFTDAVDNDDIKAAYAEDNPGKQFPVPEVEGGERQSVIVQPTRAQIRVLEQTIADFDNLPYITDPYERNAERLRLMDRARKVSLDVRAVDPQNPSDEKGGKLDVLSQNVYDLYKKWDKEKGTQLVFLDRSVPKAKGDDKILKDYDALLKEQSEALREGDEAKLRAIGERLEKFDPNEMEELRNAQKGGWTAYQQIKDNLVALGIPANEIRFVQEANTDEAKQALFDAVNDGEVRVLIGSTQRMGAGTNVQQRLVALHHADVTWKPSDIEQREGRIIRQGNLIGFDEHGNVRRPDFKVAILAYATERTIDAKMWNLNATKLRTINGIRKYDGAFTMEFADEESVSMAELAALASGDPLLLERVQLASDIDNLELLQRQHARREWGIISQVEDAERTIARNPKWIESQQTDAQRIEDARTALGERVAERRVTIEGQEYSTFGDAARAVQEAVDAQQAGDENAKLSIKIGEKRYQAINTAMDAVHAALGDQSPFDATIDGETYVSRTDASRELAEIATDMIEGLKENGSASRVVGSMLGMKLELTVEHSKRGKNEAHYLALSVLRPDGSTLEHGNTMTEEGKFATQGLRKALSNLDEALDAERYRSSARYYQEQLNRAKADLPGLQAKKGAPFPQAAELKAKTDRLEEVIRLLASGTSESRKAAAAQFDLAPSPAELPVREQRREDDRLRRRDDKLPDDEDGEAMFSRGDTGAGMERSAAEAAARKAVQGWRAAPPVTVVDTVADLPFKAPADTKGAYENGQAWLVASNLRNAAEVKFVLGHEALGHHGLRMLMDEDEITREMNRLRLINPELARTARAKVDRYDGKITLAQATEEALADLAGKGVPIRGWDKFVAKVQAALRRIGLNRMADWMEGKTQAETMALVGRARSAVVDGRRAGTTFGTRQAARFADGQMARWYSQLGRQIERLPQKSATALQWAETIMGSGFAQKGVKQDEIYWTGVLDWLNLQGSRNKVSKESLLNYLAENGVRVTESLHEEAPLPTQEGLAKRQAVFDEYNERLGVLINRMLNPDLTGEQHQQADQEYEALLVERGFKADAAYRLPADYMPQPKYDRYTLPGGEHYRELLLTLPEPEPSFRLDDYIGELSDKYGWHVEGNSRSPGWTEADLTPDERTELATLQAFEQRERIQRANGTFRSSHWDEKNVLAHIRFNDRTDAEGRKILHVEELQSDWGQIGKREGFRGTTQEDARQFFGISAEDWGRMDDEQRESYRQEMMQTRNRSGVPAAPFVGKTEAWLNLALKRVLTYAVENGYDRVTFVRGQQAVDRFQLSAQIDKIDYWTRSGLTMVAIYPKGETSPINLVVQDGVVGKAVHTPEELVGQRLDQVLGKEMADRILSDPNDGTIEGENLVIGGAGMRAFYDKIVPNTANALLKQVGGGKVESMSIRRPVGEDIDPTYGTPEFDPNKWPMNEQGEINEAQPGFDITDAMRAKVLGERGLPLFRRDERLAPNGRPSNLPAHLWHQVRTPEFKAWFGDWENNPAGASKVVDANGEPRVVYHGTHADVSAFDKSKIRSPGGFWFAERRDYVDNITREGREGFNQMPVFLNIRRPTDGAGYAMARKGVGALDNGAVQRNIKMMARDGVRLDNGSDSTWIALEPNQIKSAIANDGRFDRTNSDIRFAREGQIPEPTDPASERMGRATPKQMAAAVGRGVRAVTMTRTANTLAHYRTLGLQFLGRLQLTDVYGKLFPQEHDERNMMEVYSDLAALMDAEKTEGGTKADEIVKRWAKLKDERALAELMHDATRMEIDPSKAFQYGDNRKHYNELKQRYDALSPEARQIFQDAAKMYAEHYQAVQRAVHERIMRSLPDHPNRASLVAQLEGDFFSRRIKGVYFPLARWGDYVITVRYVGKNPQPGQAVVREAVARAETLHEAELRRAELLKEYPPEKGYEVLPVIKGAEYNAARDSVGRGFIKKLFGALDEAGLEDPTLQDTINQLILTSMPDLSFAKTGIHRKGTPGFSQDARRAFAHHMFHGANYLAKLNYSDRLTDTLDRMQKYVVEHATDPGFQQVKAQQVVDEMLKRHDAYMNPNANPLSTKLTGLGFLFYLGLSPASAMVNLLQTPTVALPLLGGKFGFARTSKELLKASKLVMKGYNKLEGQISGDERKAYDEWVRTGLIDLTMVHDLAGVASGRDSVWRGHMRGYMEKAAWMFHHAELFNRQATALAAYRLARQKGMNHDEAYRISVDMTKASHFDYSAGNRPRFMQGPIAQVIFLFKQYSQNLMYTFARNAYLSFKGATPEEVKEARKTLRGLFVTHAMAAGLLGLPAVTTLLGAASLLGGDDDDPWDAEVALRRFLAETFGEEIGRVLAHGLSRSSLSPWDISGRVGADHLIVPDVQESLQGADKYNAYLAGLLGPVVGMGSNWAKGAAMIARGDVGRGIETMLPAVLKGPVRSMRYYTEGGAKDRKGITIVDDITETEHFGQWLGFSTSRVNEMQEVKSAEYNQDQALQHRRRVLLDKFAQAVIHNEDGDREQALHEIQAFNEKHPNRLIAPLHLTQSIRSRLMRQAQAKDGLYLPGKRGLDARPYGDFGNGGGED